MDYSNMEEAEARQMTLFDSIFLVNRAGFSINMIDVTTDFQNLIVYSELVTSVF